VSYEGVAVFRIREGKIVEGYVLGDTENLKRQLLAAEVAMAAKQLPVSFGIALASEQEQQWAAELMSRSEPWVTLRRNYESALQSLRNPTHVLCVAQNSSAEPTGFLLIHPEGVAGSPYIKSIGVDERFRNAAIGTALLHFAESLFAPKARHIFICSSSFNPRARALYERLGYKLVGELKDFVIPGASELLMHKTLRPPESG
jgi:ribosomal protein S18 acetylase RimI-like enzyme